MSLKNFIELYEIYDYSYDDISRELSIPVGTVRSRLHRARNMLISDFKNIMMNKDYWIYGKIISAINKDCPHRVVRIFQNLSCQKFTIIKRRLLNIYLIILLI